MSQLHYGPRWCWPQLPSVVETQRVTAALYRAERRRIGEAEYQSWPLERPPLVTRRHRLMDWFNPASGDIEIPDDVQIRVIAPPPEFSP